MENMSKYYTYHKTPLGELPIVANLDDDTIVMVGFNQYELPEDAVPVAPGKLPAVLQMAARQLDEYFAGKRQKFDLPLAPAGTDFQLSVWEALQTIPYGETRSYGQIAAQIGNPKASRAVGGGNNKNPIAIIIPCHRVIGSSGKMVGYRGGVDIKEYLLRLEGII